MLKVKCYIYIAANSLKKKSVHVYQSAPANSQLNSKRGIVAEVKDPSICIYRVGLSILNQEVFTEHLLCHGCAAHRQWKPWSLRPRSAASSRLWKCLRTGSYHINDTGNTGYRIQDRKRSNLAQDSID